VSESPRSYRFAPRDRTGWVLGLQGAQCVLLAAGFLGAAVVAPRLGAVAAGAVLVAGVAVAFVPVRGRPLHEAVAVTVGFWARRRRASVTPMPARLDRLRLDRARLDQAGWPALPGPLGGSEITGACGWSDPLGSPVARTFGVARSRRALTGVVRAGGHGFALAERAEQERLLHQWGEALAGFCRERSPVVRVAWSAWTCPAPAPDTAAAAGGLEDYLDVVAATTGLASRTDVLVAVTVDAGAEVLAEELRQLTGRLEDAALWVDPPLDPSELRRAVAARCSPRSPIAGPRAVVETWDHVEVGGSCHAAWWVADWPRAELGPDWMEPVLLGAGGPQLVTIVCAPVTPSRSRRRVERDATRVATDTEQRARHGFRVGLGQRRAGDAVAEREAELVAGYAELEVTGLVVVTAPDGAGLERRAADAEQAAARAGLALCRLDGRHGPALAAALPLGLPVERRSRRWG